MYGGRRRMTPAPVPARVGASAPCRNRPRLIQSDAFTAQYAAFMRTTANSTHTRIERLWRFFIIREGATQLLSIRNRIER
jgi:hypothetical protein